MPKRQFLAVLTLVVIAAAGCGPAGATGSSGGGNGGSGNVGSGSTGAVSGGSGGGGAVAPAVVHDLRSDCPDLKRGDSGPCVAELRRILQVRGAYFFGEQDFGARTVVRVSQFQRNRNLPATGVVDAATRDALYDLPDAGRDWDIRTECVDLGQGGSGNCPKSLQHVLIVYGAPLQGTGEFGPKTRDAVSTFQSAHGLNPDGDAGPLTKDALYKNLPKGSVTFGFSVYGTADCTATGCYLYLSKQTTAHAGAFFEQHPAITQFVARTLVDYTCERIGGKSMVGRACTIAGDQTTDAVMNATVSAHHADACLRMRVLIPGGYTTALAKVFDSSTDPAHCLV